MSVIFVLQILLIAFVAGVGLGAGFGIGIYPVSRLFDLMEGRR